MLTVQSLIGQTLRCAETGKTFIGAADGSTTNYARTTDGLIFSDEGVNLRERRALLDRTQPFGCYLSSDGRHVTGWKGNILGTVTRTSESRSGWHGSTLTHIRAIDIHGAAWHGKGSGRGMCIALRASKA